MREEGWTGMPELSLAPTLSLLAAFGRTPALPFQTLWRTTGHRFRPPQVTPFIPRIRRAQDAVLAGGEIQPAEGVTLTREQHRGGTPTLVLGGFVPDGPEQVYLLRSFLIKQGSLYYAHYPDDGFSSDLIFAQLDDLVTELATVYGQPPVIFAVSFGAGLLLEWLRRMRLAGRTPAVRGIILVSPVACAADLLVPGEPKPTTLLGRAIKPYLGSNDRTERGGTEKSRAIFTKMFEAGAQNKEALRGLLTRQELRLLRTTVIGTLQRITSTGASARVQALLQLEFPSAYFCPTLLPLTEAPTLILYAEKEESVLTHLAPSRFALQTAHCAYFPQSACKTISNPRGSPVQHASLIFHCSNFLPPISAFYRGLKKRNALKAA